MARALGDGAFRAPGTRRPLPVAPRLVLISEMPLSDKGTKTRTGDTQLEGSLLEQLAGWTLRLPPLRERIDDLPALIEALSADTLGSAFDRASLSSEALKRLHAHLWPGNEDELRSVLGALAGRSGQEPVQPEELLPLLQREAASAPEHRSEKDRIVDALWRHGFNRTQTAEALGMSRKTLYNKIQKFGLAG